MTPDSVPTTFPGLGRIAQIAVLVTDTDRAVRFYRDILGMRLLFQASPTLAFFDANGVRLMLDRPTESVTGIGTSIVYYAVDDIQAAHALLTTRGVQFEDTPHVVAPLGNRDLWMTFFRDSEGNLLALSSEVPR